MQQKAQRVYISGPMTGRLDLNFPAFNVAAARLRSLGYEVVNPVEINGDPSMDWGSCLRRDLKGMLDCDTIALMPGWQTSSGANLELHVAHRVGIAICMVDDLGPIAHPEATMNHEGPDHGEHLVDETRCEAA
jgi:hypothetical protein